MKRCSSIAADESAPVQESIQIPKVLKVKHIGHKPARPKNLVSRKFTTETQTPCPVTAAGPVGSISLANQETNAAPPTMVNRGTVTEPLASFKQFEYTFASAVNQEIKAEASTTSAKLENEAKLFTPIEQYLASTFTSATNQEIKAGASPTSAKQENEAKPFAPTKQYEPTFTSPTNQEIKAGASPTLPTSPQKTTWSLSSALEEAQAFFKEVEPMLYDSSSDVLPESSEPVFAATEGIDQAKQFLQQCLTMDFELLVHPCRRDQFNSSLELLLKAGYFPSHVRDSVRRFHTNFLGRSDVYPSCHENIRKADKNKKDIAALREKLEDKRCFFYFTLNKIQYVVDEIKELTKQLEEKKKLGASFETVAKEAAESSRVFKDDLACCLFKSKILEKNKQDSEEIVANIDASWEEFKTETRKFLY